MNIFRRKEKYIKPNIIVNEIDVIKVKPSTSYNIVLESQLGSLNKIIMFGPKMPKPRWFQPWRWHLIPKYKKEYNEAKEKFIKTFGTPKKLTEEQKNKILETYNEPYDFRFKSKSKKSYCTEILKEN